MTMVLFTSASQAKAGFWMLSQTTPQVSHEALTISFTPSGVRALPLALCAVAQWLLGYSLAG